MKSFLKIFPIPIFLTLAIWFLIGWNLGWAAFFTVVILTFLEISLSIDNAVVNSRVLVQMSRFWQILFLTVGIFIAVFVIRFALPIIIVAVSAGLGGLEVLGLALNNPEEYGHKLHEAAPLINAFGGMFLIMVGLYYFIDSSRKNIWLARPEKYLAKVGRLPFSKSLVVFGLALLVYATVTADDRLVVGPAMLAAITIYLVLHGITNYMEKLHKTNLQVAKTGFAAFTAFLYLEVLDASFSLDGVIGAFAITDNIFIIMAGLGIGAVWVRSLTLQLVKARTLVRYKFLESGAHWAILLLGLIMLAKLFGIEPPEWAIGSVGLVCIGFSVLSSMKNNKQHEKVKL